MNEYDFNEIANLVKEQNYNSYKFMLDNKNILLETKIEFPYIPYYSCYLTLNIMKIIHILNKIANAKAIIGAKLAKENNLIQILENIKYKIGKENEKLSYQPNYILESVFNEDKFSLFERV